MPGFTKPTVLQESERIISDKGDVLQVLVLEYEVEGKKYPKLQIKIYKQDTDGFPTGRPKTVNIPVNMRKDLIACLNSLE